MTRLVGIDLPAPPELVVPIFLLILLVLSWLIAGLVRRAMARWLGGPQGDRPDKTPPPSLGLPIGGAVLMGGLLMILPELSLPGRLGRWITGAVDITFVMACALGLARVAIAALTEYAARHPSVMPALGVAHVAVRVAGRRSSPRSSRSKRWAFRLRRCVTTLGVGSLAVALALQETLANFFAGLYLLAERPVRSGDYIKIFGSEEGYVESIGWRSSRLRTQTNNVVIVPNKIMSQAVLTNYHMPTAPILYTVSIPVDGAADVETVERAFKEEIARAVTEVAGARRS